MVAGESAGPASDVYGLSLCLYLMLSGNRFPFEMAAGAAVAQWLKAHLDAPALPVTRFNPHVPPFLVALLARGLAKDSGQRPSAADFVAYLEKRVFEPPLPRAASRGTWLAGGAALLLLLVSSVMVLRDRPGVPPATSASPAPSVSVTAEPPASAPYPTAQATAPSIASPPATAAPKVASATPRPPALRASLQGDLLTLANTGAQPLLDLRIVLIDSAGARHSTAAADGVAAGENLHLALDDFTPAVNAASFPARLEVAALDPSGRRQDFLLQLTR